MTERERFELMARAALENEKTARQAEKAALEAEKRAAKAEIREVEAEERALRAEERALRAEKREQAAKKRAAKAEERVAKATAEYERIMQRKRAAYNSWNPTPQEDFYPDEIYVRCGGERMSLEEVYRVNMREMDWRYT